MDERPLAGGTSDATVAVRLMILPTFDNPVLIRVWLNESPSGAIWQVITKTNNGRGGYFAGPQTETREAMLDSASADHVLEGLGTLAFWFLPTSDKAMGTDGSQWVLEVIQGGRYHVVHRWSPENGPFLEFCRVLLHVADVVSYPPSL